MKKYVLLEIKFEECEFFLFVQHDVTLIFVTLPLV